MPIPATNPSSSPFRFLELQSSLLSLSLSLLRHPNPSREKQSTEIELAWPNPHSHTFACNSEAKEMGKYNLIIYITVAVALLLLISRSTHKSKPHRGRRLKVRSHFTFAQPADPHQHHDPPPAFDPLVTEIELRREDRQWEHLYFQTHQNESAPGHEPQPEWENFADAEDYLNDEQQFNVTKRLMLLFPRIDVDPADGFVSESELTQWNLQQSRKEALHRSRREMVTLDKNKDGLVSYAEYEAPSWVRNAEKISFGYDFGWWKLDHFIASDADSDGFLNVTEFNDFLHPADTASPKLLLWLCKEEIRERDKNKDHKVNFEEFVHGIFDLIRNYEEETQYMSESDDALVAPAKKLFGQLDRDADGYLSAVELLPIIGKLHPPEHYYAKQQTDHIMHQADTDRDGRLSLTEMIESPYVFYTAVFNDNGDHDGDGNDYGLHDEFR